MRNLVRINSRKFLIRDLNRNIKLNTNKYFEFNGHKFYRDGENMYKILDSSDNDIGSYDINKITDFFLKVKIVRYKDNINKKSKSMVSKTRKKKRYDIISNEFMLFVKEQPCIVDGCNRKDVEAHHIYGRQPARHDILCVPLCSHHHRGSEFSVHEGNVRNFRKIYTRKSMEEISLLIFRQWLTTTPDNYDFFIELYKCLKDSDKKCSIAIKDFIIETGKTRKKSQVDNSREIKDK